MKTSKTHNVVFICPDDRAETLAERVRTRYEASCAVYTDLDERINVAVSKRPEVL